MKPCTSFLGYSATEAGHIVSHWRTNLTVVGCKGFIDYSHNYKLRGYKTKNGTIVVELKNLHGKRRSVFVHNLISEAFNGPRPNGCFVYHIDGNRSNNKPKNLIYVTRKKLISLINGEKK